VSGQLYVAPDLPHGKSVRSPFYKRLGGPREGLNSAGKKVGLFPVLPGREPRSACLYSVANEVFLIPYEGYILWNVMAR
jgi:hypothetical protein